MVRILLISLMGFLINGMLRLILFLFVVIIIIRFIMVEIMVSWLVFFMVKGKMN